MRVHPVLRVAAACALAWLGTAQPGSAQPKLPDALRFVPPDALGFVHVRVGDFLHGELGQDLLKQLGKDREVAKGLKAIEDLLGVEIAGLESVTVIMPAPLQLPGAAGFGGPKRGFGFEKKIEFDPKREPRFKDEPPFKDEKGLPKEKDFFKDEAKPRSKEKDFGDKKEEATFPVSLEQPIEGNDFMESLRFSPRGLW